MGTEAGLQPAEDWENAKENFQPLKAGRKPGALKDTTADLKKQCIEEQRRAHWDEIASYKGDDPLFVWLKFIKWTQETFAAGGHKAELLPLLERCTRELQGLAQYRNDIRYLRVWVQYADVLPDPGDVFLFLKENEIGQEHALYYIAFATYLEMRGNYARADSVYQQGINRLAAPVDRLKAKFAEFQHRMARRIQRKAQEQSAGTTEVEHPGRQTLGTIAVRRPARGGGLAGPAGLKRKAGASPPKDNAAGGGLAIFMDDEFQEEAGAAPAQSAPTVLFAPGRPAAGPWSKLGSFEQSRKENTQRAGVWAGQRLKQQPAASAPPAPALAILVDPEFEEEAASGGGGGGEREPSLRQRLERSGGGAGDAAHMDEALASDPLRLHRAQLPPPAPAAGPSRPALQAAAAGGEGQPEVKRRREEVMAFDEAALMSEDGQERSFEELRARSWRAPAGAQQASTRYPQQKPAPLVQQAAQGHGRGQAAAAETALKKRQHVAGSPGNEAPAPFQAPAPRRARRATQHLAEPTMTIATRDAFAAINNMFQGSLPAEHTALPPNPYSEPTLPLHAAGGGGGGYEPTMTLATRNAFAAINNMFKGSLPGDHDALPPRAGPAAESTVTINTRAAFEAINGMFGGGGGSAGLGGGAASRALAPPAAAPVPALGGVDSDMCYVELMPRVSSSSPIVLREQAGGGSFTIREDTLFGGLPAAGAGGARPAPHPAAGLGGGTAAAAGGGFSIREDTMFIALAKAAAHQATGPDATDGSGGFSIREDTMFIAPSKAAGVGASGGAGAAAGGFCIREDTLFMGPAAQLPAGAAEGRPASPASRGFSIREDTLFALPAAGAAASGAVAFGRRRGSGGSPATAQVSKWGFAPGADDTLQLDLGLDTQALDTQALGQLGGGLSGSGQHGGAGTLAGLELGEGELQETGSLALRASGLTTHMADLCLTEAEGKENLDDGGPRALGRSIAQHGCAALQPLAELGEGSDGGAQLLQQGVAEQDSFEVPGDDPSSSLDGEPALEQSLVRPPQSASGAAAVAALGAAGAPPGSVDPFSPRFQESMLASLEPPVLEWDGVFELSTQQEAKMCAELRRVRKGGPPAPVALGAQTYEVARFVGAGTYATVHQATAADGSQVALKLEAPPCPWEWYICRALHARVPQPLRCGFVKPSALALGPGASLLVAPLAPGGSLQDLLNKFLATGQRPDEVVAMHFAMELLRLLGALCEARIVHADIKPDNLLLLVEGGSPGEDENAAPIVRLQLADFGRSVDLELLPPGTLLQGDSGTDAFRCVEMREGAPWLHQPDCYGAAGVVHCLLFGEYMEVDRVQDAQGRVSLRLSQGWRRYWATELWEAFFSALLNHTSPHDSPPTDALLARFEAHLAACPSTARRLHTELRHVATMCYG